MNMNHLKYVVAIAQEQNFSKAAQKLFISQPSLSESIHSLEKELGVELFERKPFKLTQAGEIFVKWAQNMLYEEKQIRKKLADAASHNNIKIVIGMTPYRGTYLFPKVISEFEKEYKNFNILLEEHPSDVLKKQLDEDKLDLIIDIPNEDTLSYVSIPVAKEKILLGVPEEWDVEVYSDGVYPEVDLKDFRDKPFILLTDKQFIGKISRNLCSRCGFSPNILIECHNIETAHSMIKHNMGVSFIPELFFKYSIDAGGMRCYTIKEFLPERELAVVYRRGSYMSKPVKRFIEILKDCIKSR